MIVKNEHPVVHNMPYKLAIVGEAPGMDEEREGKPFVGTSGRFLSSLLAVTNILRNACFVGNVCQYRPPDNDLSNFDWEGPEITEGLELLKADIAQFNPNLVLLLGRSALYAAGITKNISDFRGSIFTCVDINSPFYSRKCMASYHPAYCLRDYQATPVLRIDLIRARKEAESPAHELIERNLHFQLSFIGVIDFLRDLQLHKPTIAFDVEGGVHRGGINCCSLATDPCRSYVIPFSFGEESIWPPEQETEIWIELAKVLEDPLIPKILQNSLYDRFVMAYTHGIYTHGVVDDTMLKHWELYAEFEKNLGFMCSIYTKQIFYKDEIKNPERRAFWTYSALDSAITHEINGVMDKRLTESARLHYNFNMQMLDVMLDIQLRGIAFDSGKRDGRVQLLNKTLLEEQSLLDTLVGEPLNVNSPKQMCTFLYTKLKLPVVLNRKSKKPTADYETLLKLSKKYSNPALAQCISVRHTRKRISILDSLTTDPDGRIRCSYNVVGTETGRLSCYGSVTGSGTNLQTIPKPDRDLFIADPGYEFFQCDLAGADGWTVAAHCAALGDDTMLEDYLFGIKPAKVLALMIKFGPDIARLNRDDLKTRCKEINADEDEKNGYIYFISKCCQHGTNYDMGPLLLSALVFRESEGIISISTRDAELYQTLYRRRYCGIRRWHTWVQEQLRKTGTLTSANGNTRIFFGRKDSHDTHKAAYSHEPQNNTTYATNRAALNIYKKAPWIPLLHQVHDAVCGQFPSNRFAEASVVIREAFDFELVIHGVTVKIPFEGGYGPNWGYAKKPL